MDADEARAVLGLAPDARPDELRSAFRRLLHRHHPDRTDGDAATTRRLTEAYRTLTSPTPEPEPEPEPDVEPPTAAPTTVVTLDAGDTLTLALPPDEAFHHLLDAAATLGAVTAVDPDSGLLEVLVTFDDGRAASLLVSLQGRAATGTTDAFCTLEPLRPGDAVPRIEAVTAALAEALSHPG